MIDIKSQSVGTFNKGVMRLRAAISLRGSCGRGSVGGDRGQQGSGGNDKGTERFTILLERKAVLA